MQEQIIHIYQFEILEIKVADDTYRKYNILQKYILVWKEWVSVERWAYYFVSNKSCI